jgi:hypothetical protein
MSDRRFCISPSREGATGKIYISCIFRVGIIYYVRNVFVYFSEKKNVIFSPNFMLSTIIVSFSLLLEINMSCLSRNIR